MKIALFYIGVILAVALVAFIIGLTIYVNITYWNTPITEIPYWVAWFTFNK